MTHSPFRYPRHSDEIDSYLRDLGKLPCPTPSEFADIYTRVQAGDMEARELLVLSHLQFVVRIAFQYAGYGLPLADMISEGNIGLLRAVELYDARFGTAFETYASVWIRQRIHRAITSQARAVRIPVWRSQRLRKLDRLHENLSAELGCDATMQELADRLGMSDDHMSRIMQDRTVVQSLDAGDESPVKGDALTDRGLLPGEGLAELEIREEMYACLHDLDDTELQVLSSKYGLLEGEPESYREMAVRLGRNREWVRRVGERALIKVRESLRIVSYLPRKLVDERRRLAARRLRKIKKLPLSVSLRNSVLIHWLEALLPAL